MSDTLPVEPKLNVNLKYLKHRPLTRQEEDAASNCVSVSTHCKITIMPNHGLTIGGDLEGFCFQGNPEDLASTIPLSKSTFAMTTLYECLPGVDQGNTYLKLVSNIERSAELLREVVREVEENPAPALSLDFMPDWDNVQQNKHKIQDQQEWGENIPAKMGLYHCFMRVNAQSMREHKIFIVVSGHCIQATQELYNLWLDARNSITCKEFMDCAEISWLRQATLRHHNRIAARLARKFDLEVRGMKDLAAVGSITNMALPTTCCVYRDLLVHKNQLFLSNDAVLLQKNNSGIIFDCWSQEGFWVFMGPRDTSSGKVFGNNFYNAYDVHTFPSKTVRYNTLYKTEDRSSFVPTLYSTHNANVCVSRDKTQICVFRKACRKYTGFMFPHNSFIQELQNLGFCNSDGITCLMPIVMHCDDE